MPDCDPCDCDFRLRRITDLTGALARMSDADISDVKSETAGVG